MGVEDLIREKDRDQRQWPMSEMADYPCPDNQLPLDGVMTHPDYTSYAHEMLVRRLLGNTPTGATDGYHTPKTR